MHARVLLLWDLWIHSRVCWRFPTNQHGVRCHYRRHWTPVNHQQSGDWARCGDCQTASNIWVWAIVKLFVKFYSTRFLFFFSPSNSCQGSGSQSNDQLPDSLWENGELFSFLITTQTGTTEQRPVWDPVSTEKQQNVMVIYLQPWWSEKDEEAVELIGLVQPPSQSCFFFNLARGPLGMLISLLFWVHPVPL